MPTFIGHGISAVAVSSLAPRKPYSKKFTLLCMACTIAPDLDSFTFSPGIPYSHWLGHRGFSHGLLFAGILASLAFLAIKKAEPSRKTRAVLFGCFFLSAASHGVLDAMTNGGLGIAFFSPFDKARYFLPWRPISVSPISVVHFFNCGGAHVLRSEFLWVMLPSLAVTIAARIMRRKSRHRF